jgi:hypothetical protein
VCCIALPVPCLSAKGGNRRSYIACFLDLAAPFNSGLNSIGFQFKANSLFAYVLTDSGVTMTLADGTGKSFALALPSARLILT